MSKRSSCGVPLWRIKCAPSSFSLPNSPSVFVLNSISMLGFVNTRSCMTFDARK